MSEALNLGLEEEELQETEQDVPVLDDMDAEYLLKRRREAIEQYEKLEAWYAFQLEKAKALRDRTVEWTDRNLLAYLETVPAKVTKMQKSYDLPSGKLVLKHQEPEYERKDDDLVPWLKCNQMGDFVKVKESADWAALKKQLRIAPDGKTMMTGDGEIVPGITVIERGDKFSVTLK